MIFYHFSGEQLDFSERNAKIEQKQRREFEDDDDDEDEDSVTLRGLKNFDRSILVNEASNQTQTRKVMGN